MNQIPSSDVLRVLNAVAAGTTTQNSAAVDTANCENVLFITSFGTITAGAVTSVKLQQSSDDAAADDYSDLAGSSVTVADDKDNGIVKIEINRPLKRYVRATIVRGTQNAVIDGVIAIRTGLRKTPVPNHSSVIGEKVLAGPAEGTA